MTLEILRQNIASQNVISPVGVEKMKEVRGAYDGQKVSMSSEASKLQDAAEELGMSVAHRADKRTLEKREVRKGAATDLEALARIADYYDKLPDMPREASLKSLVDTLRNLQELLERSGGGGPTKDDVFAALQEFSDDVTHQFAALELARKQFEASGASAEFQLLLDDAHAEFEKGDLGRDARAGFAAGEAAGLSVATRETDPAKVRKAYRSMLREPTKNMGDLLRKLSELGVLASFDETVEVFMKAAGLDLESAMPSTDRGFLAALLSELGKLKTMKTVVEASEQLVKKTTRLMSQTLHGEMDPLALAIGMLTFAGKPVVNIEEARSLLLGEMSRSSPANQLAFANAIKNLHAEIPNMALPSPEARVQQSKTITLLQDELAVREQEEYEREQAEHQKA